MDFTVWGQMTEKVYVQAVINKVKLYQQEKTPFKELTVQYKLQVQKRLSQYIRANDY